MKVDEPFDNSVKSFDLSKELTFSLAVTEDVESVFELMSERNPKMDKKSLRVNVEREIQEYCDGKVYGVFVAKLKGRVVGFCRYYHSESVPKEKIKFESPSGYYGMGIVVSSDMRRHGIAKFLSKKRFEWLRDLGATCLYSCVAMGNETSQRMHEGLGFVRLGEIDGALTVVFDEMGGVLFYRDLSKVGA
ncbi:hypothetical protein A9Q84_14570 [Halobacteriovorax marinus]|uniref:N-acetyltransferase domain-containing protein n=1 Tax=Halobacteriovorax marinus TaxID=97084 RepID=A0A1Y5F4Z4_9BACT|nr:hypothetical protein A9Q84_14570 [Halobacteriovorax marinus]